MSDTREGKQIAESSLLVPSETAIDENEIKEIGYEKLLINPNSLAKINELELKEKEDVKSEEGKYDQTNSLDMNQAKKKEHKVTICNTDATNSVNILSSHEAITANNAFPAAFNGAIVATKVHSQDNLNHHSQISTLDCISDSKREISQIQPSINLEKRVLSTTLFNNGGNYLNKPIIDRKDASQILMHNSTVEASIKTTSLNAFCKEIEEKISISNFAQPSSQLQLGTEIANNLVIPIANEIVKEVHSFDSLRQILNQVAADSVVDAKSTNISSIITTSNNITILSTSDGLISDEKLCAFNLQEEQHVSKLNLHADGEKNVATLDLDNVTLPDSTRDSIKSVLYFLLIFLQVLL